MLKTDIHNCRDICCTDRNHTSYIDLYCDALVDICLEAGLATFPSFPGGSKRKRRSNISDWNRLINPLRQKSIFWHQIWQECDRPKTGCLASIMRSSRAKYYRAVREGKKRKTTENNNLLVETLSGKDYRDFWSYIRKMSHVPKTPTSCMDGEHDDVAICEILENKYKIIFQSTPSNKHDLQNISHEIYSRAERAEPVSITLNDIKLIIKKLNKNKADGSEGYNSNHIIYASDNLLLHISQLMELIVSHGYFPLNSHKHMLYQFRKIIEEICSPVKITEAFPYATLCVKCLTYGFCQNAQI